MSTQQFQSSRRFECPVIVAIIFVVLFLLFLLLWLRWRNGHEVARFRKGSTTVVIRKVPDNTSIVGMCDFVDLYLDPSPGLFRYQIAVYSDWADYPLATYSTPDGRMTEFRRFDALKIKWFTPNVFAVSFGESVEGRFDNVYCRYDSYRAYWREYSAKSMDIIPEQVPKFDSFGAY